MSSAHYCPNSTINVCKRLFALSSSQMAVKRLLSAMKFVLSNRGTSIKNELLNEILFLKISWEVTNQMSNE